MRGRRRQAFRARRGGCGARRAGTPARGGARLRCRRRGRYTRARHTPLRPGRRVHGGVLHLPSEARRRSPQRRARVVVREGPPRCRPTAHCGLPSRCPRASRRRRCPVAPMSRSLCRPGGGGRIGGGLARSRVVAWAMINSVVSSRPLWCATARRWVDSFPCCRREVDEVLSCRPPPCPADRCDLIGAWVLPLIEACPPARPPCRC